jgi:RHS repeat-associated protein
MLEIWRRKLIKSEPVAHRKVHLSWFTYKLQVTTEGNRILVYWAGQYMFHWDDPSPWLTGKVGFRQTVTETVEWDNIRVTTDGPGKVVAYDDFDPWGMVLECRSGNIGNAEARLKFLTKERDVETGYDWLDARGYDSRIGRFMTIDPLADQGVLRSWSPYHYSFWKPDAI